MTSVALWPSELVNSLRCACLAGLLFVASAWAQDPAPGYPNRAIRLIVPFPPGGAADALPRIVAEKPAATWRQPVIVENRGGSIGAEVVWRADPDGTTLPATSPAPLVINPSLYAQLAYDPERFVPVTVIAAILERPPDQRGEVPSEHASGIRRAGSREPSTPAGMAAIMREDAVSAP